MSSQCDILGPVIVSRLFSKCSHERKLRLSWLLRSMWLMFEAKSSKVKQVPVL